MAQATNDTPATDRWRDLDIFLGPFVRRKSTQRHCDHLEKLLPVQEDPRERRIEYYDVAAFLQAAFSELTTYGYWEAARQSHEQPTWTTILRCQTFELAVECPPGRRITLGNLDMVCILQSCLEDAGGSAFVQKLSSTSRCWPAGHADFRWLLRGTIAEAGEGRRRSTSPAARHRGSLKTRLLAPARRVQLGLAPPPPAERAPGPQPTPPGRWASLRRRTPPAGGMCASEPLLDSLRQQASSLFQQRRQSGDSALSASTRSSRDSRGTGRGPLDQTPYSIPYSELP